MSKGHHPSAEKTDPPNSRSEEVQAGLSQNGRPPQMTENEWRLFHELETVSVELEIQKNTLLESNAYLEKTLERYVDLYDFAPVGYLTLSFDGIVREANLASAALLNTVRAHLIDQQRFEQFVGRESLADFRAFLKQMTESRLRENCEITLSLTNPPLHRVVHLEGSVLTPEQSPCWRIVLFDITEQKQVTEALNRSEARFHTLLDHVPSVSVQGYGPDGVICYWNDASEKVYGYTAQEALGRNLTELIIPPEIRGEVTEAIHQMAATGQPLPAGELTLMRKDGSPVEVFSNHAIVPSPSGPPELFCMDIDIAYRKQVESRIRQAHDTYRGIFDSVNESILIMNPHGIIIDANQPAEKIHGYSRSLLIGKTLGFLSASGKNDLAMMIEKFNQALNGEPQHCEFWAIRQDDSIYLAEISLTLGHYFGEQAVIAVARNITKRKQNEEALRKSLGEQDVLLREVHHRVKNNLAAIIDLLELQRENILPEASGRLTELSNRIRSMALVHEMLYQSGDIRRIDIQTYLQALAAHLHEVYDPCNCICIRVTAEAVWMNLDDAIPCGLIVNELTTNALKHAFPENRPRPGGSTCEIIITIEWDGAVYTLSIADNGVGLPAGLDWAMTRTLGLRLVRMLGQHQLRGCLEFDLAAGTRITLRFNPQQRCKTGDSHEQQNHSDRRR